MIAGQIPRGPLAAMAQTTDLQWLGLGFGFSVPRARIVPLIKAETNFQVQNTAAISFVSKLMFHIWSANLVTWDTLQLQQNKFIFNSSYLIALQLVGLVCGEISTSFSFWIFRGIVRTVFGIFQEPKNKKKDRKNRISLNYFQKNFEESHIANVRRKITSFCKEILQFASVLI